MSRRVVAFAVLVLLGAASPVAGQQIVEEVRKSEAEVRQAPLPSRPNRLGHVYGNNVRRLQQRTLCVNCGKTTRPLRRYMYMTR